MLQHLQKTCKDVPQKLKAATQRFWDEMVLGDMPDIGKQSASTGHTNAWLTQEGLHSILRYDQYDETTGLFYNDHSVAFCFEVLPQTGADEEMSTRLATLFTPIPPHYGIQWCLFGSPILDDAFQAYLDLRDIAIDQQKTSPFFKELAQRRIAYLKSAPGRPLWPSSHFVVKQIRLLFSITKSGSHQDPKLIEDMMNLRETMHAALRTASLPAVSMDAERFIRFMWPILNPQSMFTDEPFPTLHYDEGKSLKDQMTAFGQQVRVTSNEILWGAPQEQAEEPDTRIAARSFGILQYPQRKELWEMADIVGAFFNDNLHYPCPFLICGGAFTLDPNTVDTKAQLKSARAKQNASSKMAFFQPELAMQAQDWDIAVHQLNNGGNMCEIYHSLVLFSPKTTLNRATQTALNIWKSAQFTIFPLKMLHLATFYASLPMTFTSEAREDLHKFRLLSTKTTVNAVDMAPVIGEWQGAGDPVMLFFGRRGSATFLDFYSNKQQGGNYNVFVTGVSGSGKSVCMNEIISGYRGIGARVWVIDVGRSYRNLIALQGGTFLEFAPDTKICINPFSWVGTDSELDFKSEMRMLRPAISRMASPNTPLTEFQSSLVTEAITAVWKDYGPESNPTLIRDYLRSIKDEKGRPERIAHELAKQLQPFTKEGVFGSYVNGPATLRLDGDMVGLELEELKPVPDLRRVVLLVLISRIANEMYFSRDVKKAVFIDEAQQLLGPEKEAAESFEEAARRYRKYNGMLGIGTQGIQDAFSNAATEAIYNNSDWKIYLRQDPKVLEKLIKEGKASFSPAVKRMLLSLRAEHGRFSEMLISSPMGEAVVRHVPDPFSLLMASTNPTDFTECEALLKQGYSTMEALTTILKRRGQLAA